VSRRSVGAYSSLTVIARDDGHEGRGESTGVYYEGETVETMRWAIAALIESRGDISRDTLMKSDLSSGARNAIDCALWDLEAKRSRQPVERLLGLSHVRPLPTAVTLSRDTPDKMATAARRWSEFGWLKVKVGGNGDIDLDLARIEAVRGACSDDTQLIVDPNSSWSARDCEASLERLARLGVVVLEQPTAPGAEPDIDVRSTSVRICADEAVRHCEDISALHRCYGMVNIKLEKAGGLTPALELMRFARALGLQVMVGCMNGTSLAIAPAFYLAQLADLSDLDSPLDLVTDRPHALEYANGSLQMPDRQLWG
jgi:L-alanine-DL-glutamate epimerase-like enolase superfamily enzyme